ncbi:hypothetical protein BDF14DRAFT_1792770, partial [Spinellus fusiger]
AACPFKGSMRRESKASNFSDENASGDCPYSDETKNTSIDVKDQIINPIPCPPRLPFVGNVYDMLPDM